MTYAEVDQFVDDYGFSPSESQDKETAREVLSGYERGNRKD